MNKYLSRKFVMCVAAVLASLGTTVGGIISGNETLAIVASICTALRWKWASVSRAMLSVGRLKNHSLTKSSRVGKASRMTDLA